MLPSHSIPANHDPSDYAGVAKDDSKAEFKLLIDNVDLIIIDEISMVAVDVLNAIDVLLRDFKGPFKPFGGVQMVFIGDLFQLPPIKRQDDEIWEQEARHFFSSVFFFGLPKFKDYGFENICLRKTYRQKDKALVKQLDKLRSGEKSSYDYFNKKSKSKPNKDAIFLTTTNYLASKVNDERFNSLGTAIFSSKGKNYNFPRKELPCDEFMTLRIGMKIMFVVNTESFVNGQIGVLIDTETVKDEFGIESMVLIIESENEKLRVSQHTFQLQESVYDEKEGKVKSSVVGWFTQFPIKKAWAVTIHKSQGLTFDDVNIDFSAKSRFFSEGQLYVAISRCTKIEGVSILKKLMPNDIKTNQSVLEYYKSNNLF
jgi:ATP-dependent exoDNAse (exonuclease V) alpha subunit